MFKNLSWLTITIALGIIVLLFGIAFPIIFSGCYVFGLAPNLLGDYLGGTSGTVITLGTAFLVFANYLQQKNIIKDQRNELAKKESDLKIERFESHFFQLLNLNANHLNSMQMSVPKKLNKNTLSRPPDNSQFGEKLLNGRNCFMQFHSEFKFGVNYPRGSRTVPYDYSSDIEIEETLQIFNKMLKVYSGYLSYYLNNIESQIELLSILSNTEAEPYVRTFKNQFSATELVLILYYAQIPEGEIISKFFYEKKLFEDVLPDLLLCEPHKILQIKKANVEAR